MYVKPAVCMMYVFNQKYIDIHAFATNLYFVFIVCMYVCVCMCMYLGFVGRVGRATARNAMCRGFDPCRQRPRGVAVDFGP
jgi:hypothetical protein